MVQFPRTIRTIIDRVHETAILRACNTGRVPIRGERLINLVSNADPAGWHKIHELARDVRWRSNGNDTALFPANTNACNRHRTDINSDAKTDGLDTVSLL